MTDPDQRCALGCRRRHDPLMATAPPVTNWLLIEQPGPWGGDALRQSRLPPDVVDAIARQAAAANARVLLIRRPGRDRTAASRRWAFADTQVHWSHYGVAAELKSLRLNDLPPGDGEPVYLVCTHGRHDRCCAIDGRPLAAALAALRPGQTWECSHVGGDRFAANLVVLPHGLYYGQIPAGEASAIVDRHDAGLVSAARLRGRSTLTAAAQAAQHFARDHLAEFRIDALAVRAVHRVEHEVWRVTMAAKDGDLTVTVRARHHRSDTPLTCAAHVPAAIRTFELVQLR